LSKGFEDHSGGTMKGCTMAIDGLVVRTRQPFATETDNIMDYRNRKGGYAICVLAGSDINARFLMATANYSGSTHDSISWQCSAMKNALDSNRLDARYFIIGDEAFSCTNQILSPWPGRGLGRFKDSFNYWLSHSRQCIERAFGILCKRWGIFWRPFTFALERWALVILVSMKLHNFCIDRNEELPAHRFHDDQQPEDIYQVDGYDEMNDHTAVRNRAVGDRRLEITNALRDEGRGRPPHAMCNSVA
jgi:hypothetical protein